MQKLLYLCTVNLRRGLHVLSGGFADILKRRLLRSVLTGRNLANFELKNQDLATIDVLGMCISCTRVPYYLGVRAHMYISAWASRCRFYSLRQCESLWQWNDNSRTPRFFICLLT